MTEGPVVRPPGVGRTHPPRLRPSRTCRSRPRTWRCNRRASSPPGCRRRSGTPREGDPDQLREVDAHQELGLAYEEGVVGVLVPLTRPGMHVVPVVVPIVIPVVVPVPVAVVVRATRSQQGLEAEVHLRVRRDHRPQQQATVAHVLALFRVDEAVAGHADDELVVDDPAPLDPGEGREVPADLADLEHGAP